MKKTKKGAREAPGVTASGNFFFSALAQSLLVFLVPAAALIALLVLVLQPREQHALLENIADGHARQAAASVSVLMSGLRERALAAGESAGAQQALEGNTPADIERAERAILEQFPEALSVRLLSLSDMGTARLDENQQALRNLIEVDLVRRSGAGDVSQPEAYQHDGQWLISLAMTADEATAGGRRAAVLVSLPGSYLAERVLAAPDPGPGALAVEQKFIGDRGTTSTLIAGDAPGSDAARARVADTPWTIVFSPSAELVAALGSGTSPLLYLGALLVAGIAGFALLAVRYPARLRSEVARAEAQAQQRTALKLTIPEIVPLVSELRTQALRRARPGSTASTTRSALSRSSEAAASNSSSLSMSNVDAAAKALPTHIFRAYDIRGIAETELDDDTVFRIGAAIGTIAESIGEQTLILGYDGRLSSERIKSTIEKALLQSGRDVINIGLVPTPLMYFAVHHLEAQSGVMITGSHNPGDHNGLKIVFKKKTIVSGGVEQIRTIAKSGKFSRGSGHLLQRDVTSDYLDEVVGDIALAMPLKVVIDAGNGAASEIGPALFEELGCEVIPLYCKIDGRFPNHPPDTSNEDNLRDLAAAVRAEAADFGVAFDGDGDRLAVVTGEGDVVRADTLLMLLARDVVGRNPGADVIYDVKCSRNLAQLVTGFGGRGVMWKSGHALMKEKMAETGALLGGEFSGHIFFGERWYGFDDGMYVAARLAEIISSQEDTLGQMIGELPTLVGTPEIIIPVAETDKFEIVERFTENSSFPNGKINTLDGIRVDFQNGWGLLRASNTSAALTARFEATTESELMTIMDDFRSQLSSSQPDLDINF